MQKFCRNFVWKLLLNTRRRINPIGLIRRFPLLNWIHYWIHYWILYWKIHCSHIPLERLFWWASLPVESDLSNWSTQGRTLQRSWDNAERNIVLGRKQIRRRFSGRSAGCIVKTQTETQGRRRGQGTGGGSVGRRGLSPLQLSDLQATGAQVRWGTPPVPRVTSVSRACRVNLPCHERAAFTDPPDWRIVFEGRYQVRCLFLACMASSYSE